MSRYHWAHCHAGCPLPYNAVKGGQDIDGSRIFVGRARHAGDLLPTKVIPEKQVAYVCWGGGEHLKHEFEVLCADHVSWSLYDGGDIPFNAIPSGRTSCGETLYTGRALHENSMTIGKIQPSHGVCTFHSTDRKFRTGNTRSWCRIEQKPYAD